MTDNATPITSASPSIDGSRLTNIQLTAIVPPPSALTNVALNGQIPKTIDAAGNLGTSPISEAAGEVTIAEKTLVSVLAGILGGGYAFKVTGMDDLGCFHASGQVDKLVVLPTAASGVVIEVRKNADNSYDELSFTGKNINLDADAGGKVFVKKPLNFTPTIPGSYANNAAALAAGVLVGELYYTDTAGEWAIKIAH